MSLMVISPVVVVVFVVGFFACVSSDAVVTGVWASVCPGVVTWLFGSALFPRCLCIGVDDGEPLVVLVVIIVGGLSRN